MQGATPARQLFEDLGDRGRWNRLLLHGKAHPAYGAAVTGQDIDLPLALPGRALGGVETIAVLAPARDLDREALLALPAPAWREPLPVVHDAGAQATRCEHGVVKIELVARLYMQDGVGAEQRLPFRGLVLDTGLEVGAVALDVVIDT